MELSGVVLSRRQMVKALAGFAAALSTTSLTPIVFADDAAPGAPFSFDVLTEQMRALAAKPHTPDDTPLPDVLQSLTYDEYRRIVPRDDKAKKLSSGFGYFIEPFPLGWLFKEPVAMFTAQNGTAKPLPFDVYDFTYRDPILANKMADVQLPGVAGFRIDCPLNDPSKMAELVAFLGASYFRALGRDNVYGASARGAAINTWLPQPEEFPRFTTFYAEPADYGQPLTIYAALDGPSVTGAFRFVLDPGTTSRQDTVMDVTGRFFFRADVTEMGIAPLTSMFLYSDSNRAQFDDYRPQVHDSDGLIVDSGKGEIAWRALNNPPTTANSYFEATNVKAFGLMQRERDFDSYQDPGALYDKRPSILVEPKGDWGEGSIRLIEVPAKLEADDNIVAYWVPKVPFKAGDSHEYSYRLRWGDLPPDMKGDFAYVQTTRGGQGGVSGVENKTTLRKFVVDFVGGPLADPDLDVEHGVLPITKISGGGNSKIHFASVSKVPETGVVRLAIDVEVDSKDPIELRAYLVGKGRQLTETWLYQWRAA